MPVTTPLLAEALEEYLAVRGTHLATRTMESHRVALGRFTRDLGAIRVDELTCRLVEEWFAFEATVKAPSTYNNNRHMVRTFLGFCTRRGWLVGDPMEEIRPRPVRQRDRLQLNADQLRLLYDSSPSPRDRGMLALAACTGLRASDVAALRIGDVNLAAGLLRVEVQKTGRVDRLPLALEANIELRRWLTEYARRMSLKGRRLHPEFILFPATDRSHEFHHGARERFGAPIPDTPLAHPARIVQEALRRIGFDIGAGEGFHTIRRSVGRLVFDKASSEGHDAALRLTASLLGHSSTVVTETYLGISLDRTRRDEFIKGRPLLGTTPPETSVTAMTAVGR